LLLTYYNCKIVNGPPSLCTLRTNIYNIKSKHDNFDSLVLTGRERMQHILAIPVYLKYGNPNKIIGGQA
jgi:hypothetical protein